MKAKQWCYAPINEMTKIESPFFLQPTNWDNYTNGDSVYYVAKYGTGCDSGYFGDLSHMKNELCRAYVKYANRKGLFLSLSMLNIYSIERLIGNYLKKYIA